jgi:cystathionine gamma-lyase
MIQSLGPGAHIVSVNDVYGGTFRYMARVAKETQGVDTTFVDLQDADDETILSAFRAETKLVWIESPTNPTLRIVDIPRIVRLAHSHPSQPLVIVDNTFLSPYYQSPLLLGADVVMHSMTKYINGHSDVVMGALVVPAHRTELAQKLRFLQNATGAVPSAFDCWLAQRGAKTLHLRMQAHGANAVAVARALEKSPHVDAVIYPGLPSHPRHAVARASLSPQARKYVNSGAWRSAISTSDDDSTSFDSDAAADDSAFPYGGMISFRIRGGGAAAKRFLTATRLFTLAESLGGVESLAELPAEMTHGSIPAAEREALGITDNLIRLSVGVEDAEDLVADVERALEVALNKI